MDNATKEENVGKNSYAAESTKAFMAMDATSKKQAKSLVLCYGRKDSDVINWQILGEDE